MEYIVILRFIDKEAVLREFKRGLIDEEELESAIGIGGKDRGWSISLF